jgi:hypothetical protein
MSIAVCKFIAYRILKNPLTYHPPSSYTMSIQNEGGIMKIEGIYKKINGEFFSEDEKKVILYEPAEDLCVGKTLIYITDGKKEFIDSCYHFGNAIGYGGLYDFTYENEAYQLSIPQQEPKEVKEIKINKK